MCRLSGSQYILTLANTTHNNSEVNHRKCFPIAILGSGDVMVAIDKKKMKILMIGINPALDANSS